MAAVESSALATRATVQIWPGSSCQARTTEPDDPWVSSSAPATHSISPDGLSW